MLFHRMAWLDLNAIYHQSSVRRSSDTSKGFNFLLNDLLGHARVDILHLEATRAVMSLGKDGEPISLNDSALDSCPDYSLLLPVDRVHLIVLIFKSLLPFEF